MLSICPMLSKNTSSNSRWTGFKNSIKNRGTHNISADIPVNKPRCLEALVRVYRYHHIKIASTANSDSYSAVGWQGSVSPLFTNSMPHGRSVGLPYISELKILERREIAWKAKRLTIIRSIIHHVEQLNSLPATNHAPNHIPKSTPWLAIPCPMRSHSEGCSNVGLCQTPSTIYHS